MRAETAERHAHAEDIQDGGAHDPAESLAPAGCVGARHAAHLVGGGPQRNVRRPSRDEVRRFRAIARGEDARQVGLHVLIHPNRAGAPHFHAAFLRDLDVGPQPGSQDHQLAALHR